MTEWNINETTQGFYDDLTIVHVNAQDDNGTECCLDPI